MKEAIKRINLGAEVYTPEKCYIIELSNTSAVVIGGKVVTVHKIRSEIPDGRVKITQCTDNACEILYLKLTESFHLK